MLPAPSSDCFHDCFPGYAAYLPGRRPAVAGSIEAARDGDNDNRDEQGGQRRLPPIRRLNAS